MSEQPSTEAVAWLDEQGRVVRLDGRGNGGFVRVGGAVPDSWTPLYPRSAPADVERPDVIGDPRTSVELGPDGVTVHLSKGGGDPLAKVYSAKDVEVLISIALAARRAPEPRGIQVPPEWPLHDLEELRERLRSSSASAFLDGRVRPGNVDVFDRQFIKSACVDAAVLLEAIALSNSPETKDEKHG